MDGGDDNQLQGCECEIKTRKPSSEGLTLFFFPMALM